MVTLTIFGAVVGAIDISNKIYQDLDAAISHVKNVPDTVHRVLSEIDMVKVTLESFHRILQTRSTLPAIGPSQLTVGAVSDAMEDCVRTLDTLAGMTKPLTAASEAQPVPPFSQKFRWAINDRDTLKQLERLHRVQACLQSLIIVLTSDVFNDITNAVASLSANLTKSRMDLPLHEQQIAHSEPSSPVYPETAAKAISWGQRASKAEFEAKLDESGVYRRARRNGYDKSFQNSANGTSTWSFHSSGSIPSVISVLSFSLRKDDLGHPEFYNFSTTDDDKIPSYPVSHFTLSALQARATSRKSDLIPWRVGDQLQTASPPRFERKSFSADCEALTGNRAVPCMGSLYFDHGLQKWPSPEEIGLKLTRCASDGLLDEFLCSHCDVTLAYIVISQRPHWTEHSVFCQPCGAQLRVLHGDAFCPCADAGSKVYVKYYDLSSSQSLVRCSSCFSCCFSCSRPRRAPTHSRKVTPTEHPLRRRGSLKSMDLRVLNAHKRNISASSADSSTSGQFRAPSRLRDRPMHVSLLPSPPISPYEALDAVVPEAESLESLSRPPSISPFGKLPPRPQTPPDSARDMPFKSENDTFRDSNPFQNEAIATSRRPPRGHRSSRSRDFIMAIPERPSLMSLWGHGQRSSSISKVWFHNRSSSAPTADLIPATSWNGRILFHHDAVPCLKFILAIPQNEQRDYRAAQFRIAGSRGLLDHFKCLSCRRGLRTIFTTGTGPDVYLSYFLWCGRVETCNAVNPDRCLVCPCHTVETGRLHIGYYDALEQQVVVRCSNCFTSCRDCRMDEAVRVSEAQAPSFVYYAT